MICHSGAGTLLDCLKNKIQVVSIVNEKLADNH